MSTEIFQLNEFEDKSRADANSVIRHYHLIVPLFAESTYVKWAQGASGTAGFWRNKKLDTC